MKLLVWETVGGYIEMDDDPNYEDEVYDILLREGMEGLGKQFDVKITERDFDVFES